MDLATWQAALARNLTTAFLVTKAALPPMTSRGWGRIIQVASVTGPVMAIRADVGYASAKAGMVGLTRAGRGQRSQARNHRQRRRPRLDSDRIPNPGRT